MLPISTRQLIFSSLLSLILLILCSQNLQAADFRFEADDFSLKSSPAGKVSEVVLLTNLSDSTKTISLSWRGYKLAEGNYLDSLTLTKHSIDFASINPSSLTLGPRSTGTITISFQLPEKTTSGDYYGSLVAHSEYEEDLVDFTLTVLGKLNEKIEVLGSNDDGKNLSVRVLNEGNITVSLTSQVNLHNLFGQSYDLTGEETNVRAGEVKTITFAHPTLGAGLWQEKLTLKYGAKNTSYTTLNSFWVNPAFFFIPFALILLALTTVFVFTWRNK